jgi:hypothetical protein
LSHRNRLLIRLNYATSMANIEKGLDRIDKFRRTLAN